MNRLFKDKEHLVRMAGLFARGHRPLRGRPRDPGARRGSAQYGHYRPGALATTARAPSPSRAARRASTATRTSGDRWKGGKHAGDRLRGLPRAAREARRGPVGQQAGEARPDDALPRLPRRERRQAGEVPADRPDEPQRRRALHDLPQPARARQRSRREAMSQRPPRVPRHGRQVPGADGAAPPPAWDGRSPRARPEPERPPTRRPTTGGAWSSTSRSASAAATACAPARRRTTCRSSRCYFRTWVERYHVERGRPRAPRSSTRPTAATTASPRSTRPDDGAKSFFVPEAVQPLRALAVRRRSARSARRSRARTASSWSTRRYCLGCRYCVQACPYGCRFIDPRTETVDKCTLCYHRITKGLTTACCETCPTGARQLGDLKNPKDPIHEFLRDTPGAGAEAADGDRRRRSYYNGLDGSVR